MQKKFNGFTLLEIMFAIGFLGIASLIYVKSKHSEQKLQLSKTLGEQAKLSSKYFANYILQNESQISKIASTTAPIIIPFDQVINSGITPVGVNNTNILNQKACVSILKNPNSGNLEAIMYYVSNGITNKLEEKDIIRAVHSLSGVAGLYKNGQVNTNSWSVQPGSLYFAGANTCASGYTLNERSLVVNLTMLPEFNRNTLPDVAVKRVKDLTESLGSAGNRNTTLSNITFSSGKGIYMNNSGQPELIANGSTLSIQNGDLMARSIQGTESIVSGTTCQPSELGKVAKQNDPQTLGFTQSSVICSYNPLVCASGYCYVPSVRPKVIYSDSRNAGSLGNVFYCPANMPFLEGATAYQQGNPSVQITILTNTMNGYTVSRGARVYGSTPGTFCTYHYSVDMCSGHASGDWECKTVSGSPPPPAIVNSDGYQGGTCGGGAYQKIPGWGGCPWGGAFEKSKSCVAVGPAIIKTATCTNKGIINVN